MIQYISSHPYLLAIVIFFARICDVSLGTVRTIILFRGYRILSGVIGFFEVFIWIMAAGQVLKNSDLSSQWFLIVAYCAGFATGNIVGIWLEGKLAIGYALVRVISENVKSNLAAQLRQNYHVVEIAGKGKEEKLLKILFITEKRSNVPDLLRFVRQIEPESFYTVEDIRSVYLGI